MFESQGLGIAPRYRTIRGSFARLLAVWAAIGLTAGCLSPTAEQTSSDTDRTQVTFAYLASTTPRTDFTPAQQDCVDLLIATHVHPSWRAFFLVRMTAVDANRWQLTLNDVPVGVRVSVRVTDPNFCVEDPLGRVDRDVFADEVRLGPPKEEFPDQPDFFFTVGPDGTIMPE